MAPRPAALLHDTIEDTETSYDELRGQFGARIADIVAEVTDTKFLGKQSRKRLQLSKAGRASAAAQQVKIADKLCNLRDMLVSPPAKWSERRKHEYFDWAKAVVDQIRQANPRLAERFDAVWEAGCPSARRISRTGSGWSSGIRGLWRRGGRARLSRKLHRLQQICANQSANACSKMALNVGRHLRTHLRAAGAARPAGCRLGNALWS